MVPGLALDRLESRELCERGRTRRDKRQLALFGQHQQQILVRQHDHLPVAVASPLPVALAIGEIDGREDATVEAERMAVMRDEVIEVRLQSSRCPALFDS